ncbi:MAG: flagellar biosynthetic protein FliR [Candidatus Omnitrophota bacterium]
MGTRFMPAIFLTPLFGGRMLPTPVKMGLACVFGLMVRGSAPQAVAQNDYFGMAAEFFTGLVLCLPVLFTLKGIEMAGHCFDLACGTNSIEILYPSGEDRSSPTAIAMSLAVVVVSFGAGIQCMYLNVVLSSYDLVHAGAWLTPDSKIIVFLIETAGWSFASGISLAAPFLVMAAGVDLALSYASRIAPGFSLFSSSMVIKNFLALCFMVLFGQRFFEGSSTFIFYLPGMFKKLMGLIS